MIRDLIFNCERFWKVFERLTGYELDFDIDGRCYLRKIPDLRV
jgi:hypothetical protein